MRELRRHAVERSGELVERLGESFLCDGDALRELAGRIPKREPHFADRGADTRCGIRQRGDFARAGARGDLGVARELRELAGGQLLAEEQRGGVRKLVRLVEDDRVACGQELGETFVAQHHVGEEQVVVDDDDVGLERGLAGLQHEAIGVKRAVGAEAVVARRRDERPDRRILGNVGERAAVAGLRRARERDDARQMACVLARGEASLGGGSRQMMMADVVGAALEQRDRQRKTQRVADEREVALEELVLQRLRPRGNDHLAAVEEGGHEIREGLAGAGARLGDQRGARGDGVRNRLRHRELLRPEAKSRERARQRSAVAEYRGQSRVGRRCLDAAGDGESARQFVLLGLAGVLALFVAGLLAGVAAGVFGTSSAERTSIARSRKIP